MTDATTSRILRRVHHGDRELVERMKRLNEIAVALSAEHDVQKLLGLILDESRRLTRADSGSIFVREDVVEENPTATAADDIHTRTPLIALKVAQNDSLPWPLKEIRLPFDHKTIAGHVALSGQVLHIPDVYHLPDGVPYTFSTAFDRKTGYRSKSMLVMPMRNRDGDVIGVIQLINKKSDPTARLASSDMVDRYVQPFDEIDEELVESLASQAAICIERTQLYDDVQRSFDGMVESFTHALEKRNRTTFGHCLRVAGYAEAIARAINECDGPPFESVRFTDDQIREIRYAGLLHDIGKLAVPEAILDKQNKLTDDRLMAVQMRFRVAMLAHPDRLDWLQEAWEFVRRINIPRGVSLEDASRLREIAAVKVDGLEGTLLDDYELENLAIARGNLTAAERKVIEQHITDTWEMLRRVPWPRHLTKIPNIAASHHEKLDGSGYPWGLPANRIPMAGKILAIVDIYEALTAKDRPYKAAMPMEKALAIVESEVKAGRLDADLYKLFVDRGLHRLYADETGMVRVPKPQEH